MPLLEGELAGWIIAIVFIIIILVFIGMQFGGESKLIMALTNILESRGTP